MTAFPSTTHMLASSGGFSGEGFHGEGSQVAHIPVVFSSTSAVIAQHIDGVFDTRKSVPLPVRRPSYSAEAGRLHDAIGPLFQNALDLVAGIVPWARVLVAPRIVQHHPTRPDRTVPYCVTVEAGKHPHVSVPLRMTTIALSGDVPDALAFRQAVLRACWEALEIDMEPDSYEGLSMELADVSLDASTFHNLREFRAACFSTYALAALEGHLPEPETIAEQMFADACTGELGKLLDMTRDTIA